MSITPPLLFYFQRREVGGHRFELRLRSRRNRAGAKLDLATRGRFPNSEPQTSTIISRAILAWERAEKGSASPYELPVVAEPPSPDSPLWHFALPDTAPERRVLPAASSSRLAARHATARAANRSPMPAFTAHNSPVMSSHWLTRTPASVGCFCCARAEGAVLGDLAHPVRGTFALSPDGRMLARRDIARAVVVSETADPGSPSPATASPAALHDALAVRPQDAIPSDHHHRRVQVHSFRLEDGSLKYQSWWEVTDRQERTKDEVVHDPTKYDTAVPHANPLHLGGWRVVYGGAGGPWWTGSGKYCCSAAATDRSWRYSSFDTGGPRRGFRAACSGGDPRPGRQFRSARRGAEIEVTILAAGGD